MNDYKITARVRKVGAIGVFYPQIFYLSADSESDAKDRWAEQNNERWELYCFERVEPVNLGARRSGSDLDSGFDCLG